MALKERKRNAEIREFLEMERISLAVNRSRVRWFGHIEHENDADVDWVKCL